jgi:8-oxo-dGTP pyrophosphatase MutT (NUDIX family)
VRPAATVLVIRDRAESSLPINTRSGQVEVLMLRRSMAASFLPGAYVFPGGVVDAEDAIGHPDFVSGMTDARASQLLGVTSGGLAYWVAAVRECFEEAGLLVATQRVVEWRAKRVRWASAIKQSPLLDARRLAAHRVALLDQHVSFGQVARDESITIVADQIVPWSRWITPIGGTRRFDTRFFVTRAPVHSQIGVLDEREMTHAQWFTPDEALANPDVLLITPTQSALRLLMRFCSVDDVISGAINRAQMSPVVTFATE